MPDRKCEWKLAKAHQYSALANIMRVVRHIREAKITHHILIYIEPKYYHIN